MTQPTFYWHDYETWGANPQTDRPAQFAGLRTTLDFEPVGRPMTIYCQPTPDFLPHPQAVMITGITPQHALAQGMNEAAFAEKIAAQMSEPDTTIIGYNNIAFDDEVTRHLFYRNFIDPYAHTWQDNNSRWDLIDLMRACYALRPEAIEWPYHDDGRVSMKLEDLTRVNNIEHGQAHDAMADVYATIAMAQKVKHAQPRLFDYAYSMRRKQAVKDLVQLTTFTALAHVSGFYGAQQGYLSVIMPLAYHPDQPNSVIYWDLRCDPQQLLQMSEADMVERRFTRRATLQEQNLSPFGGGQFALNKCPFIAPLKVIDQTAQTRWQIDLNEFEQRRQFLIGNSELREKIVAACCFTREFETTSDPDLMLYSGAFFSDQDRSNMAIIRATDPDQLAGLELNFADNRLPEMLFRYRARNFPRTLNDAELQRWRSFCQHQLMTPPGRALSAEQFMHELEQASVQYADSAKHMRLLHDLYRYVQSL
jgi:exodeoxyribonuclease-1